MPVFKKQEIIETYPGYDIAERDTDYTGCINVTAGDTMIDGRTTYEVGSVISYAQEDNRDPIEAYNSSVERGHSTHWLVQLPTVVSNSKGGEKPVHLRVNFDAVYMFEGRKFRIVERPNNNLAFVDA